MFNKMVERPLPVLLDKSDLEYFYKIKKGSISYLQRTYSFPKGLKAPLGRATVWQNAEIEEWYKKHYSLDA